MDKRTIQQISRQMPDHLRVKIIRVARERNISFADAIIFLVEKGINA